MAKFNDYLIRAESDSGYVLIEKKVRALSLESAWHKAVSKAFEAVELEIGVGERPETISVSRVAAPSEHHG